MKRKLKPICLSRPLNFIVSYLSFGVCAYRILKHDIAKALDIRIQNFDFSFL